MRRLLIFAFSVIACSQNASAQWMYPRGYGGYGMSQWGADPGAGYMAGLGSYARGQGVYDVEKAKADSINVDTMAKWNKALRARQIALRQDQAKEKAKQDAERNARVAQMDVEDGTILNSLLMQILDSDPTVVKYGRARAPLSPSAIREIPFEWDSEAITICVDQMTGKDSLPSLLMDAKFADERRALQAAVAPAIKEDVKGSVSPETQKKLTDAVSHFRAYFLKNSADFEPGYLEAQTYLTTMASLTRMLNDPSMKAFLAKLENGEERTVGDLIAFMNSYNLRFGAATSDRQIQIYTRLVPILQDIATQATNEGYKPSAPDRSGDDLKSAAKSAFQGMSWDQLEAHSKGK